MTRQNLIPPSSPASSSSPDVQQLLTVNALIPLWDFCNHQDGKVCASFFSHYSFFLKDPYSSWPALCKNCVKEPLREEHAPPFLEEKMSAFRARYYHNRLVIGMLHVIQMSLF